METIKKYGIPFLIGGTVIAGIKYTSHHMPQKYAAVVGALPLGLLSTLFIIEANKTDAYIRNYTMQTFVTVLAGLGIHSAIDFFRNKDSSNTTQDKRDKQELKDIEKEMKKHKKMQKQLNAKGMTLDDVLRQMKKNRK